MRSAISLWHAPQPSPAPQLRPTASMLVAPSAIARVTSRSLTPRHKHTIILKLIIPFKNGRDKEDVI